jgi:hypothetical protein
MLPAHCPLKMAAFQGEHSIWTAITDYRTREGIITMEFHMCVKIMYGDCNNDRSSVRCFKDHFNLTLLTALEVAELYQQLIL